MRILKKISVLAVVKQILPRLRISRAELIVAANTLEIFALISQNRAVNQVVIALKQVNEFRKQRRVKPTFIKQKSNLPVQEIVILQFIQQFGIGVIRRPLKF